MPTFRNDMASKQDLGRVTTLVHGLSVATYGIVAGVAIWAHGAAVRAPVSNSFSIAWFKVAVAVCMVLSLLSSTALYLNPPGLEIEEFVGSKYQQ